MGLSDVRDFFGSSSFAAYRSGIEGKQKLALATLGRFDSVLKGMGALAKLLVAVLKRRGK